MNFAGLELPLLSGQGVFAEVPTEPVMLPDSYLPKLHRYVCCAAILARNEGSELSC